MTKNLNAANGVPPEFEIDWADAADVTLSAAVPVVPAPTPENTNSLAATLTAISAPGVANTAVQGIGSLAGGQMLGVGFPNAQGYLQAMRNGVPPHTHRQYLDILRARFGMTSADLAKEHLPQPMTPTTLPNGVGIKHTHTGPSIFDRPVAERAFVVAPPTVAVVAAAPITITTKDLIAGAVAEGQHSIVGWDGTSGMTRGALLEALTSIGRESWAPKAPNARAQAGATIRTLSGKGYVVRANTKAAGNELEAGEHEWCVGQVGHMGVVGDPFGTHELTFRLAGSVLTYTGPVLIGAPIVAAYNARVAAELFKSSDVTSWLVRILKYTLDAVKFGALGYMVPARNVASAKQLCNAVQKAHFGTDWVTGLPIATGDELRDGIARGLTTEVSDLMTRLGTEREIAHRTLGEDGNPGDIGHRRIQTFLQELRTVATRVVAYGQLLGEHRVATAKATIRAAIAELETILGGDYGGTVARFALIWEEIKDEVKHTH